MRQGRLLSRTRGGKKNSAVAEVDITSLLDILTILMVFLLLNFNSSGVFFDIPKGLKLPKSQSLSLNNFGVNVQVSTEALWVDNKELFNTEADMSLVFDKKFPGRILPLYNELVAKKEGFKNNEKLSKNAKPFSGVINLIVDKSIKYEYLKKIMYTCADAGFKQYKFVVMNLAQ